MTARKSAGFMKGVGAGMAAGLMVGAVSSAVMHNKPQLKKKANRALDMVGGIVDNIQYIIK